MGQDGSQDENESSDIHSAAVYLFTFCKYCPDRIYKVV